MIAAERSSVGRESKGPSAEVGGARRSRLLHLVRSGLTWLMPSALLLVAVGLGWAAEPEYARLRHQDLASQVGQRVQVKGRTGIIVESKATETYHVFTLRDDYGDMVEVYTRGEYPIMGATYVIEGTPQLDGQGVPYLEEHSRWRAYPVVPKPLLPTVAALVVVGVAAVAVIVRRRALKAELAPAWGYAEVVAGPDQGKSFALRGEETIVGRGQDPNTAVSVVLDMHVSRRHGKIVKQGSEITYEDTNSTGGSWINEEQVEPGHRAQLTSGALLRLGPRTVLRFGLPSVDTKTRGAGDTGSVDWGEAPTERAEGSGGSEALT